jgi:D-3-phosphoglycerate dehydrogenase
LKTVYLSHPIIQNGLAILEKNTAVITGNTADLMSVHPEIAKADAMLVRIGDVHRDLIMKCPNLRVIMRPGVGTDNIDISACTERGIPVAVCPGTNLRSVAEHAVALAYAITKNLHESVEETKKGNFTAVRSKYAAIELENHNLGVIGFGNIGRETARLFARNDMHIFVYDPFVAKEKVEALGYSFVDDLYELLGICDMVTLHMPSTPQTRGMFGPAEFAAAKDGMFLINCARGDIIDEEAMYQALVAGKLGGAAMDVMCAEPFNVQNPLLSLPNFIATPHMAALTQEAAVRTFTMAANNLLALLHGEELSCVVNREVYDTDAWKAYKATL